jgi:hypothetical protein
VQLSAVGELQFSVTLCPGFTPVSLTESDKTGTETASTVTVRVTDPPEPEQERVKSLLGAVRFPVDAVPLRIRVPVMARFHAPLAVHAVALVLDQRRVVDFPTATLRAAVLKVSVGAAGCAHDSTGAKNTAAAMKRREPEPRICPARPLTQSFESGLNCFPPRKRDN